MRMLILLTLLTCLCSSSALAEDTRQLVKLPAMMQAHMLANMRNHLETLDMILGYLAQGELDRAADTAESRLGMSSLETHDAKHLAQFMPKEMQAIGTNMHHAASRFVLKAQEGDTLAAYNALHTITANCVACHAAYRIR
jgi:cytochrome c556